MAEQKKRTRDNNGNLVEQDKVDQANQENQGEQQDQSTQQSQN